MRAILYIQKRAWINRIRHALKKPGTYIYLLLVLLYLAWLAAALDSGVDFLSTLELDTPLTFAAFYSIIILYLTPSGYVSYARHKGLAYIPADVHFVFCAPVSPKKALIYVYLKTLPVSLILGVFLILAGVLWFHIPLWRAILFYLVNDVLMHVMTCSLIVCLYGNERFGERAVRRFGRLLYLVLLLLIGSAVYYLCVRGLHVTSLIEYLSSPYLELVPFIGWQIAVMRLILAGPELFNVIGACLCAAAFALLTFSAWRMRCTGEYYEDAMTFADDYQAAIDRKKKGDTAVLIGKKQKLRRASIRYRGGGASAVFYRQMLEYKKRRFFLFGMRTLFSLALGAGAAALVTAGRLTIGGAGLYYAVPGMMAYLAFIFSASGGQWEKELENPYIFMIPDAPLKKLWYATAAEHIRAAIDGFLLSAPIVVCLGMPPRYILIFTAFGVFLRAASLYADTVGNALIGKSLGNTARQFLRMGLFLLVTGITFPVIIVVHVLAGPEAGLLAGCACLAAAGAAFMAGGAFCFVRMELRE